MFKKLIQYWQGGIMKTILRTPFFLILFTIFSVSFSVSSATGQTLPVVDGSYQVMVKEYSGLRVQFEQQSQIGNQVMIDQIVKQMAPLKLEIEKFLQEQSSGGTTPPPGNTTPGIPPVINGSYMQQMAEIEAMSKEIGDLFRAGKPDEGQKKEMEQQIKKENAIVGEMIRLYGNNLSTELKNFALNIDASFKAYQRQAELSRLVIEERNRLGEPSVGPPGVTPPDGPPSNDPVEAAKKAKELAEQNVNTATTELDEAKAARLAAEQKLADAKTALEKAEQDLEKAIADKDAELQVAEKAVEDAKQILADAKSAWVTAKNELMELENKLNTVKNTYKEAEKTTRGAERALFVAENNVRRLKGQSELPVVGGSYMGQPGLPVVGGSYMGQPGLPVVGGSYQGPPQ